ncbi:MAG: hypothetical protein KAR12_00345 [Methylococcales bacterium]|nr:hypothetical protein [Methylococcales bacterium]
MTGSKQPIRAIKNLTEVKVNAFKGSFELMNFGEEQNSCFEIQGLNVIPYRVTGFNHYSLADLGARVYDWKVEIITGYVVKVIFIFNR